MIKKSILLFIIILAVYETGIRVSHLNWDTSQNDKSANLISAQDFIYNGSGADMSYDTIIVGSSVSRKLNNFMLGENYTNLAFNAWGSFDGLDLLERTNHTPSCILIEMNFVGAQDVKAGIKSSLEPVSYYPNKILKSLQLKNQPVGILIGSLKNIMRDKIEASKRETCISTECYF